MSYLRIQTTIKKPGKNPNRKNARTETKVYQYVYEIMSRRGTIKRGQQKTKRRRYKAIVHDVKKRLGPYKKLDQVKKNKFTVLSHIDLDKNGIIMEAIKGNLLAHGFIKKSEDIFEYPGVVVNLKDITIKDSEKSEDMVLGIYTGFLCPLTIKRLLEFELNHEEEYKEMAKYIQDLGLLPNEVVEIPKERGENTIHVDKLIKNMEKVMGEEKRDKKEEEQDKELLEMIKHNKLFMEVMGKTSPYYQKLKEEAKKAKIMEEEERNKNSMSLAEFTKKHSY